MDPQIKRLVELRESGASDMASRKEKEQLWKALTSDQKKQSIESWVFIRFAEAAGITSDPYSHTHENPPLPDISVSIGGQKQYFELGQIVDEKFMKNIATATKLKQVAAGTLSQDEPFEKMLREKCTNLYQTSGCPINLLLYYWVQGPYPGSIDNCITRNKAEFERLLQKSQFSNIWVFDWPSRSIHCKLK